MARSLVYTSFLLPDCGEALAFFTQLLRWGVREDIFAEASRGEAYGRVVVFPDPLSNCWDLIEPSARTDATLKAAS